MTLTAYDVAMTLRQLSRLERQLDGLVGFHRACLGGEKVAIDISRKHHAVKFARRLVEDTYPEAKALAHELEREKARLRDENPGRELGEGLAEVREAVAG